jgi:hypothetical protein
LLIARGGWLFIAGLLAGLRWSLATLLPAVCRRLLIARGGRFLIASLLAGLRCSLASLLPAILGSLLVAPCGRLLVAGLRLPARCRLLFLHVLQDLLEGVARIGRPIDTLRTLAAAAARLGIGLLIAGILGRLRLSADAAGLLLPGLASLLRLAGGLIGFHPRRISLAPRVVLGLPALRLALIARVPFLAALALIALRRLALIALLVALALLALWP